MQRPRWPWVTGTRFGYPIRLAILCAAYFAAAKAGLAFAFSNQSVTAIWPPTGIALAAVLLWGYRMWPAVAVGAFLANVTTAGPVASDLAIAAGNTLEAVFGAFLRRKILFNSQPMFLLIVRRHASQVVLLTNRGHSLDLKIRGSGTRRRKRRLGTSDPSQRAARH